MSQEEAADGSDQDGRRKSGDRRKEQLPFDGPDRRKGDRRSGDDRRKTERKSDSDEA